MIHPGHFEYASPRVRANLSYTNIDLIAICILEIVQSTLLNEYYE